MSTLDPFSTQVPSSFRHPEGASCDEKGNVIRDPYTKKQV